jgi:hypothetical protein
MMVSSSVAAPPLFFSLDEHASAIFSGGLEFIFLMEFKKNGFWCGGLDHLSQKIMLVHN